MLKLLRFVFLSVFEVFDRYYNLSHIWALTNCSGPHSRIFVSQSSGVMYSRFYFVFIDIGMSSTITFEDLLDVEPSVVSAVSAATAADEK